MKEEIAFELLRNGHYMKVSANGMPRYLEKKSKDKYLIKGKNFLLNEELFEDFDPANDDVENPKKGFKSIEFDGGPCIQVGSIIVLPERNFCIKKINPWRLDEEAEDMIFLDRVAAYLLTVEQVNSVF